MVCVFLMDTNKLLMKQLSVLSLLVLKWCFRISNGSLGSDFKLSTSDFNLNRDLSGNRESDFNSLIYFGRK